MTSTQAVQGSPIALLGVIDLPGRPRAASSARKFVRALFNGVADDRLDDLELVVTELVTNALRHTESGRSPNGEVSVAVASFQGDIFVNVTDDGSATSVPHLRLPSDVERLCGRGLRLVDQIAENWGYRDRDGKRVVWLRLGSPDNIPDDDPPPWPPPWSQAVREMSQGPSYEIVPGLYFEVPPEVIPGFTPGTAEPEPQPAVRGGGPRGAVVRMRCQEIINRMAERIAGGKLGEGTRMASVQQLMAEHGIPSSAATYIQRALRERGLIRLVPGLGYVIGAPDTTSVPPRPPVHDQITMIAQAMAEKIHTGEIIAHQRLTTRQLMTEHGISRGSAWIVLRRLVSRGWAYDTERKGVRAAAYRAWLYKGTSMTLIPTPANHAPTPATPSQNNLRDTATKRPNLPMLALRFYRPSPRPRMPMAGEPTAVTGQGSGSRNTGGLLSIVGWCTRWRGAGKGHFIALADTWPSAET
ncbi:ATP-binding protein [Acrocarpospora sp. B8E8]|uniref:ATP-binding protein n=1 Tax=Acrocarpospora sp. B8E8 TaxID=3153572 RepID=UPI00325D98F7